MDQRYQPSSLLPYLTGARDIQLDFSDITGRAGLVEAERGEGRGYSHDLDSLSRRYHGRILCGGSVLRKVSLVIQRDEYPDLHFRPALTNSSIDECWQRALARRRSPRTAEHHVFLNDHTDAKGNIRPFSPLSYCRERRCFFHPPCARCGKMLQLCTDDVLLGEFGLPHYSRSLRRYLYCPDCTPLHGSPWFACASAGEDESVVKDRMGLLNSFGAVSDTVAPGLGFPCPGCSFNETCYGPDNRAGERVAVIAFYPFYMFLDGEVVLDGEFFLGLLSGGALEEIEAKRSRELVGRDDTGYGDNFYGRAEGFLFPGSDGRHFLEILYLKLLFLKQVAGDRDSSSLLHYMSNRYVSPRELGVFRPVASSLPPFWNFALTYQSIEQELECSGPSAIGIKGGRMLFFGFFFFVVLLVRRDVEEEEVLSGIKEIRAQMEDSGTASVGGLELFQPRNILWDSGNLQGIEAYGALWERVVDCGLSLLSGGVKGQSMEQWLAEAPLEKCMREVASLLFQSAAPGSHMLDTAGEDREILTILDDISARWAGDMKPDFSAQGASVAGESSVSAVVDVNTDAQPERPDPDATVIIPADPPARDMHEERKLTKSKDFPDTLLTQRFSNKELPAGEAGTIDSPEAGNNSLEEETLLYSGPVGQPQGRPGSRPGPGGSPDEDGLLETVQIKKKAADPAERQPPVGSAGKSPDDLLEETVVLNSSDAGPGRNPGTPALAGNTAGGKKHLHSGKIPVSPEDEEDFLTETVVLKPKKRES